MSEERVEFRIILNGAGEPELLRDLLPRCPVDGHLIRGDVVRIGHEFYHKGCAPH